MKRLLLAAICISLCWFCKAQCTLPYKTLAQFRNDTTAFINYNFSDRADCYAGKPLSNVLTDLGIPIRSFTNLDLWDYPNIYRGIEIYIYSYRTVCIREENRDFSNIIVIRWENNISASEIDPYVDSADPEKWTSKIENILRGKTIKSISVVRINSSTPTPASTTTPATRTPAASQTTGPVDAASRRATTTATR